MPWVTIILSMAAAMSLTLAAIHFRVWVHRRESRESLLFTVAALAAVATALLEAWLMHAETPADYSERFRWLHLPVGIIVIALAWLIPVYLKAGRAWLAGLITAVRGLLVTINFSSPGNATFREISGLRPVTFLGETLAAPIGTDSPWRILAHLSVLLLVAHALDAGLTARRLRTRPRPLLLSGVIAYAAIQSAVFSSLMARGVLPGPFVGLGFTIIVIALSYELSNDLIRSNQMARDLEKSEGRMRLAAAAADLFLWEWDMERDEVWVVGGDDQETDSPATLPMTLDRFLESIHPDDRIRMQSSLSRALAGEGELQAQYRQFDDSGHGRWFSVRGTVIRDARDRPLLVRGASRDITGRKQAELELEARRRELAHVQRVSTVEQLSSALVHELSQPLGAILRNAEAAALLLQKEPADLAEIRSIVADILGDDRRATRIIDRLRALLKRRDLAFEKLPVGQLLAGMERLVQTEFQARGATLRVEIEPRLPDALGDPVHIQQVLLNLLSNALDAVADEDPGRRTIDLQASPGESGWIEFAVVDRGAGIPSRQLENLFEPFFSTKPQGTGLGLSISRTITEAYGGRIWAESNPEGGATFRFTIRTAPPESGT
jgi:two-component system sensor kinase FixL